MEILDEKDGVDTELLVYAMTLVNKVSEVFNTSYQILFPLSALPAFRPHYILKMPRIKM